MLTNVDTNLIYKNFIFINEINIIYKNAVYNKLLLLLLLFIKNNK